MEYNRDVGTAQEREDLDERLETWKKKLKQAENPRFSCEQGLSSLHAQMRIDEITATREKIAPTKLTTRLKNTLYQRSKDLERTIKEGMPTCNEMNGRSVTVKGSPTAGWVPTSGALRKHGFWRQKNDENIAEWKSIQRTLDPDNPEASNVEGLRS